MDIKAFYQIGWMAVLGLVFVYGSLKLYIAFRLSARSRKELTANAIVSILFILLLAAVPVLAKDVSLNNLAEVKYLLLGTGGGIILLAGRVYFSLRLRTKGVEAPLINKHIKGTNFIFNTGGKSALYGKDREILILTYDFVVNGKTYSAKKRIIGTENEYLVLVLYDPRNPKRNIPVPVERLDGMRY